MCDRNRLSGTDRWLLSILAAVLAIALLLGIPGNPENCAGQTEELYFCILHTNDMHSELIPHSPA
ncbi:MAG TPA: hypothetical protein VJ406_01780, partial [Dehalococcoidia bacterium]|nr:hypothetical protein [Dehalococcoidia bacterium]